MRRKIVAGNWKMNGSLQANQFLLEGVKSGRTGRGCDVIICPPAPYLQQCQVLLSQSDIELGAQDLSMHEAGAYTGEISAEMIRDLGGKYVIVGHSERRTYHDECDVQVGKKVVRALIAGLTPIVCVGETLTERESGKTADVIGRQVDAVLNELKSDRLSGLIFAYEPVWAIGTGKTATPEMAQEVHATLRKRIAEKNVAAAQAVRILYGGSVKADNAKELFAMPDIDGGLIGGASLKSDDFLAIIRAAE